LPNLNAAIDSIRALTPRGTTNIRDGLYAALGQIQTPATRAAVQVALLLTDGKHNTPYGSRAIEVLPDFQEAGVRIYTLGVGQADAVDMDVLDQLAFDTDGRSYAVGDDHPGQVQTALVEIRAEVDGGIITTAPAIFPDSRKAVLDELTTKWIKARKRPSLKELLELLKISPLDQLIHPPKRILRRLVPIPVDVEQQCDRVSFSLVYPENHEIWLYLVDAAGHLIDMEIPEVHHVISSSPHEFAIVEKPKDGRWYMIAVRPHAGSSFTFQAVAGGENRHLQVFGEVTRTNYAKAPVRLWASARFIQELSNLRVTATVIAPNGRMQQIRLTDDRFNEPNSGVYEAYVTPKYQGRYRGWIRIENLGSAIVAQPNYLISHSKDKSISIEAKVPKFVREIPFYFDSGERPDIKDEEREKDLIGKYATLRPRPTKLKSARR
jgi:hypothetical protein